jgi:hypothetical protein
VKIIAKFALTIWLKLRTLMSRIVTTAITGIRTILTHLGCTQEARYAIVVVKDVVSATRSKDSLERRDMEIESSATSHNFTGAMPDFDECD